MIQLRCQNTNHLLKDDDKMLMDISRLKYLCSLLLISLSSFAANNSRAISKADAQKIGIDAVIYGLPLIVSDLTRQVATNVASPRPNANAPMNQLGSLYKYPTAADKDVVRLNVDTLYTFGFVDLSKEPMVLSVPDTHGRYYLMPLIDAWTNVFASPGKRTTGAKAANFIMTGPNWNGPLPDNMKQFKSPTNIIMVAGRTQADGPADYAVVNAIQRKFKLTPLSAWGKPYTPPAGQVDSTIDMSPPSIQISKMSAPVFFNRLAKLLSDNPPPAADRSMIMQLAKIGVIAGQSFDADKLDPSIKQGIENAVPLALQKLQAIARKSGKYVNGWNFLPKNIANFGTAYETRGAVALIGFGANLEADATYQMGYVDSANKTLSGDKKYTLHYNKGTLPPVNAFWSITLYNAQSFFVANAINRYNIAAWMPLKYNADGSLDIYIQHESPGKDKESNWLPAPKGEFSLTMREYWPKASLINQTWVPAAIVQLGSAKTH